MRAWGEVQREHCMAFEWLRDRSRLEARGRALESNLEPLPSPRASQTHWTQPSSSLLSRPSHYQNALLDAAELMQQIRAYEMCSTCQLSTINQFAGLTHTKRRPETHVPGYAGYGGANRIRQRTAFSELNPQATSLCPRPLGSTAQRRGNCAVIDDR
jgi:hypothetical protein